MTAISFEFYPPKTDEQRAQLDRTAAKLKVFAPEYVSCTFGAGGSTLSYTSETVRHLKQHHGFDAAPHLSCVGGSREEIRELLKLYRAIGCRRIVALRGDLPSGMGHPGDLRYASELISFIRAEHGDAFRIEVGAYPETHPQANDALLDLKHFKTKIDAGADAAITQYFFNADAYFHFVDAVRKLGSPCRSCRASCRSPISASYGASPSSAAPRFRAGSASACRPTVMMPTRSARSVPRWSPACANAWSLAARRACTSTRSTWPSRPPRS